MPKRTDAVAQQTANATIRPIASVAPSSVGLDPPAPPKLTLVAELASQGLFRASDPRGGQHRVSIAVRATPQRHRRPLAFARLAGALGCADAVADTRLWRLGIADVGALMAGDDELLKQLRPRLAIEHDGRVSALFEALPAGRELAAGSDQLGRLQALASDAAPIPTAERPLVRAWVCVRALDYIAGNVMRQSWWLAERPTRLLGIRNDYALPGYVDPAATRRVLDELSACERFPPSLYRALLDRPRQQLLDELDATTFVDSVLGPRQRADVADRMATVASLIHARVAQRGSAGALSL